MLYLIYFILILFTILDFFRDKHIITPIKIFNFIWFITLFLYNFMLSYVQTVLSFRTYLIFFLFILFFNLFSIFFLKLKSVSFRKIYKPKSLINQRLKIVNIIFIIIFIFECIYCKYIPLISGILTNNTRYLSFGIPSLHGALNGLAICMGAYYLFKKGKEKYIYLLFGILTVSRQVLLSMIIEGILINIKSIVNVTKKINYKKYILLVFITLFGFVLFGNFRSGDNVMKDTFNPRYEYKNLNNTIMWVYSYMEFSVSNFNKLVSLTDGGVNYGVSTLVFFLPTIVTNKINLKPNNNFYYLVQSNFTVSTAFPEIYLDFGILGMIVFSIIIAFIGAKSYKNNDKINSAENKLKYALYIHNIVFLFFVNMFIYLPVVVQYFYIPIIFRECEKDE